MPENKKVQGLTKPEKPRKTRKCEVMQPVQLELSLKNE